VSGFTDQRPAPRSAGEHVGAPAVPTQVRPDEALDVRIPVVAPPATGPGSMLGERYRLRTRVGFDMAAGAEFWRAEDVVLQRDVAMTVLRRLVAEAGAEDPGGAARAGRTIVRALRSGSFEHPGCARLLDVLAPGSPNMPDDVLGAAVTEWVPGHSLAEHVADGLIKPTNAARAVAPLAAAAEEAHRHGFVLGCDHPQRVRITPEGRAQLCFAMPRPELRPADDVRGLGAVLFTLLTSRWPLSGADAARAGLAAAERSPDGAPEAPSVLRPGVPVELDALATGTLATGTVPGRVHTAAAVRRLLDEVIAEDDRVALFPPVPDGVPSGPGDVWQDRPTAAADPERRRKLVIGMAALGVAALIASAYVAAQVGSLFSDRTTPQIIVSAPVQAPEPPAVAAPSADHAVGGPVRVASVEVFDDTGDSDNAGRVTSVIDGDLGTSWRTFVYRQQFPALKPGVGIMASFASPVQLAGLTIDSPSPGTRVEVRSAPTANADFDDTVLVTEVTLADGETTVSLADSQPLGHILLWITELGGGGSENVTEINEVEFRRAGL
jgi:hypothetical protein